MRDWLSFSGRTPLKHAKQRSRWTGLCKCRPLPAIMVLHILLAGCSGPEKVAKQPTGMPPIVQASASGTSVGSPAVQETLPQATAEPVVAGAGAEVQKASQGPKITFEKTFHDYGQVGPASKNVCEFRFKNTGTGLLTVGKKIGSTCGCTATTLAKTEYAPGEEGVIKVTYSASTIATTVRKYMTVHSNDKENPQARLTIAAKIVPRVAYEPQQLDLLVKDNAATCPPITLRSLDGTAFSVARMLCTGNSITADFDTSVRATEFTIRPTVDVEKLQRLPAGYLALTLTHPECRQVTIRYNTRSCFQFVPALPMFFDAEPNVPVQKVVHLSNDCGEDFEIASFSSQWNLVEVLEKTRASSGGREGARYRLTVSVTPPMRTGSEKIFADTLSVHLTNGRTLKLDCRGIYATTQAAAPYPPP